jgi:type IV pilus assembly protein PilV
MPSSKHRQSGVMLIEALVGILIFMIGILALIAMQATAIRAAGDARYRTEAVNYSNDLLGRILVNVDRSSDAAMTASLTALQHQTSGSDCAFSGAASASAVVTDWVALVTGTSGITPPPRPPLPGTTAAMLQVAVNTAAGSFNRVTITVCWQAPDDPVARKHVLVAYVT